MDGCSYIAVALFFLRIINPWFWAPFFNPTEHDGEAAKWVNLRYTIGKRRLINSTSPTKFLE